MSGPPVPPSNWGSSDPDPLPDDELFGFVDDPESESPGDSRFGKAQQVAAGVVATVEGVREKLLGRRASRGRHEEMQELLEFQQQQDGFAAPVEEGFPVGGFDPQLERNIVRLPSRHEREQFLAAEQQTPLFAQVEQARSRQVRVGAIGLWVAAALFVLIGLRYASGYVSGLLAADVAVPSQLLDLTGSEDTARGALFVLGMLTPLLAFLTCANAVSDLLIGLWERSVTRLLVGAAGAAVVLVAFSMLHADQYLGAFVVQVAGLFGLRVVAAVLERVGGRR